MTYSNYNDFAAALFTRAESVKQEKGWRYGQALFNCLHEERPDIANELRTSSANPFYRNAVDPETYETIRSLYEIKDDQ
jgi:hypothetical protein